MLHRNSHIRRAISAALVCLLLFAMASSALAAEQPLTFELVAPKAIPVYQSPNASSRVIGLVTDGTELSCPLPAGDFYEIDCGGLLGYISAEAVTEQDYSYYVNCPDAQPIANAVSPEEEEAVRLELCDLAQRFLGTPYRYGGNGPASFDCSGFVCYVYNAMGFTVTRTATTQLADGLVISDWDLQPGDLVYFGRTGRYDGLATHVGIYLGDGEFIHAASGGVAISSLDEGYYADHYLCARQVLVPGSMEIAMDEPIARL